VVSSGPSTCNQGAGFDLEFLAMCLLLELDSYSKGKGAEVDRGWGSLRKTMRARPGEINSQGLYARLGFSVA
jgi:hypothetical protein